jgi:hypothetical protein
MAHAHVQLVLYRPFLHHISLDGDSIPVDKRSYTCARACIEVSCNVVHVTHWFTMYTMIFTILSLVFFTLENESDPSCASILKDVTDGRNTLASFAKGGPGGGSLHTNTKREPHLFEMLLSKYSFLRRPYLNNYPGDLVKGARNCRLFRIGIRHHHLQA